eukprot:6212877-Pleurochrysis_carterae.AAC.1
MLALTQRSCRKAAHSVDINSATLSLCSVRTRHVFDRLLRLSKAVNNETNLRTAVGTSLLLSRSWTDLYRVWLSTRISAYLNPPRWEREGSGGDVCVHELPCIGYFVGLRCVGLTCGIGFLASLAPSVSSVRSREEGATAVMSIRERKREVPTWNRRCMYLVSSEDDITPMWCEMRDA